MSLGAHNSVVGEEKTACRENSLKASSSMGVDHKDTPQDGTLNQLQTDEERRRPKAVLCYTSVDLGEVVPKLVFRQAEGDSPYTTRSSKVFRNSTSKNSYFVVYRIWKHLHLRICSPREGL